MYACPSSGNLTRAKTEIDLIQQQADSSLCLSPFPIGRRETEASSPPEEAQHRFLTHQTNCCGATV